MCYNIELNASDKCRSTRKSAKAIYHELRASDKCRRTRKSSQAIYHELRYRRAVGFSSKIRFKNQYIFVCMMGARVVSTSAFVAGATAVFDTKQYAHNKPKL